MKTGIKAVVEKVFTKGPHGPYAIATTQAFTGSVTFSLEPNVWQEQGHPAPGEVVFLYELREKRQGWRAKKGRYWMPSDEQTAMEEDMLKKLGVVIEGLKNKWFPTGDDKTWKQWVDYKRRETRDLRDLLKSDVNDGFKRRALFLLIVPSADLNPIYWKEEVGKFYHSPDFFKGLSQELLNYVAELITEFATMLRPLHCDRPKNVSAGGGGVTVFMSIPDKYHDALRFYNDSILALLSLMPPEQGEKLFQLFSLRDISTYWNMDYASGYTPFTNLMYSDVGERWKRLADARMRKIVDDEVDGKTQPREEWEGALHWYANMIQTQTYGKKITYSHPLFADQMKYLVNERHFGQHLIDHWRIMRIFQILSGEGHKDLRHQISRFVVLKDNTEHQKFSIYDEEGLAMANRILDEFGKEDPELADRLNVLIKEGKERIAERAANQSKEKETEEDILAKMK